MASIYQRDIENRFPTYTVAITTDGSLTLCTVTVAIGGATVVVGRAPDEEDAAHNARRHLKVGDDVLCALTTTQRNEIVSPKAGLLIFNTTTGALETYSGSAWV